MELRLIGSRIFALNLLRRNLLCRCTAGFELRHGQLPLLETVIRMPGCQQHEAAARLGVTPASVALSAKRLQKAGLIDKQIDPDNRRRNRLTATEKGLHAAETYRRGFDAVDAQTFSGFTEEELAAACALFERMIRNLDSDGTMLPMPFEKENPHA